MSGTGKAGIVSQAPKVKIEKAPKVKAPKEVKLAQEKGGDYIISKEIMEEIMPKYTDEQKKYIKCWNAGWVDEVNEKTNTGRQWPDYGHFSCGADSFPDFLDAAKPKPGETVVDWGCGSGKASKLLYDYGLDVTAVDFAFNCLDEDIELLTKDNPMFRFIEHDIGKYIALPSEYGFCVDVLEHLPEDEVDAALDSMLYNSKHLFLQIDTAKDGFGQHPEIQEENLHLTVKPYQYWLDKLVSKTVVIHKSNIYTDERSRDKILFYVTGWGHEKLKFDGGFVNVEHDVLTEQIIANSKLDIQPVIPWPSQDTEIMLIGGGPTLNDFTDEIIEQRAKGMPMITTNGAYNWAIANGMKPSMQCMIDAREFNNRFVQPALLPDENDLINGVPYQGCQYFISSQCHASVFESLPKDQTYMWHVSIDDALLETIKENYGLIYDDWFPCPGGSTVMLRAICLLRMLGFAKIHIYGFDSCIFPENEERNHHAYEQKENDISMPMDITVGKDTDAEKTFQCEGWQVYQAREFQLMVEKVLMDCQISVKGDGLISYMIETAAALPDEDDAVNT